MAGLTVGVGFVGVDVLGVGTDEAPPPPPPPPPDPASDGFTIQLTVLPEVVRRAETTQLDRGLVSNVPARSLSAESSSVTLRTLGLT